MRKLKYRIGEDFITEQVGKLQILLAEVLLAQQWCITIEGQIQAMENIIQDLKDTEKELLKTS